MALTFTSWTAYTDDGGAARTLDWSSPAAIRGRLLRPYAEAIRQAIGERYAAIGATPAAILQTPIAVGTMVGDAWYAAVQAAMTALVYPSALTSRTLWHSGAVTDHTGRTLVSLPTWDMTTLLAYLGESRITTGLPLAAWAYQQYRMLRQLTATWVSGHDPADMLSPQHRYVAVIGDHSSWAAADAGWPAATWHAVTPGGVDVINVGASKRNMYIDLDTGTGDAGVTVFRRRSAYTLPSGYSLPLGVTPDVHLYLYAGPDSTGLPAPEEFDTQGDGMVAGWNRISITSHAGTAKITTATLGDVATLPPNTPTIAEASRAWLATPKLVLDFAVPGGFTFQ